MIDKRIFFLAPDNSSPSGGRLMIYHLVDILVKLGYDAHVLHQTRNFRYDWFSNATPVCHTYQMKRSRRRSGLIKHFCRFYLGIVKDLLASPMESTPKATMTKNDILVLPATLTSFCNQILPGMPKVSLSQNPYLLFKCSCFDNRDETIFHPDIIARITMSELNYAMHCLVFPESTIWNVPVYIDSKLYNYSGRKLRKIAYMPRRMQADSLGLISMLKLRGKLQGFEFVAIDGMSQAGVANTLKDALMFLSFSHREGFGLPPAEAMACGCIVVGYSGNGGDEFFDHTSAYKIPDGDLVEYALKVESLIQEYISDPEKLDAERRRASEQILTEFGQARTEKALMNAWKDIMQACEER